VAQNQIFIARAPEDVFGVLADPFSYEHWVVGSSEIRDVEGNWPEVGATFHHTQFVPRVGLKDTTSVLEIEKNRRLLLCVRARPAVVAKVELRLEPEGEGTTVTMTESPIGGIAGPIHNPLFDLGLRLRNAESLRRLRKLAESSGR
jgi:uncharacterized protein YndB with AHSA1/START domain